MFNASSMEFISGTQGSHLLCQGELINVSHRCIPYPVTGTNGACAPVRGAQTRTEQAGEAPSPVASERFRLRRVEPWDRVDGLVLRLLF
jgi:hypothetical protein